MHGGVMTQIRLKVNGREIEDDVEPRVSLVDFLRDELHLTGTHTGCEHGVCGACSVMVDGDAVRSCLMFAVQANDTEVTTVEGLAADDGTLSALQDAFWETHAMQCGYCTPGMLIAAQALLNVNGNPTDDEIRMALEGNLCRCTGYVQIVEAVALAARNLSERTT